MKVLLRQNVAKLGHIGDVVEVRPGYARNYLIPQHLAMEPSEANLKAIDAEKQAYLAVLAEQRAELEARAQLLAGKEFTLEARANVEGHLYGSVGPAQIAAAVVKEGFFVDPDNIALDEPIRKLDKYQVQVQFAEEVQVSIGVWVVPPKGAAEGEPADAPAEGEPSEQDDSGEDAQGSVAEADEQPQ